MVLSGLRPTGKTTFLQNEPFLSKSHRYRTLDDFATLAGARANPASLLQEPVILDEVQRCPELLLATKSVVDQKRRSGRFILSGPANLALLRSVSEGIHG